MNVQDLARERERRQEALDDRRRELSRALRELKVASGQVLRPRTLVASRPYLLLAGAFALGLHLGSRSSG